MVRQTAIDAIRDKTGVHDRQNADGFAGSPVISGWGPAHRAIVFTK